MLIRVFSFVVIFFVSQLTTLHANEYERDLVDLAESEMRLWAENALFIEALLESNKKHANYTISQSKSLERRWQQERRKPVSPFIKKLLANDVSETLRSIKEQSEGVFTELILIDGYGFNVGQTGVTGSYWHGKYPYWQQTFESRSYGIYTSEVEFNDTTHLFQATVAFMIVYQDDPIGIIYAGIDVENLEE